MQYDASRDALYRPESKPVFVNVDRIPQFQPDNLGFSLVNAWWLSNASHLAYYETDRLEQELRKTGLRLEACFSEKSTQAFLATSDKSAILAFRGTESDDLADLKIDADILLATFTAAARVHRGFLAALDEIWEAADESLQGLTAQGLSIWYTGHSLGAALATLAAARRKPNGLFTFGSPRVGDEAFVRLLDGVRVQRIVNCSDMAATVPGSILGYRHVGDPVFITATARLLFAPSTLRVLFSKVAGIARYWATLPLFRSGIVKGRSFADHAIVNYTAALDEAMTRYPQML
jgi:hypothetical protein